MLLLLLMMMIKPSDAYNITAGRARMKAEWFNPKYKRQSLEPEERYYFEQVRVQICVALQPLQHTVNLERISSVRGGGWWGLTAPDDTIQGVTPD